MTIVKTHWFLWIYDPIFVLKNMDIYEIPSISFLQDLFNKLENKLLKEIDHLQEKNYNKKYYRNKDLKKYFGLSDNTIQKYREQGILPYSTIGTIPIYPVDEINKLIEDNRIN